MYVYLNTYELNYQKSPERASNHFSNSRLDETDAFYVDVIHTDANPLMSFGLGMWQSCGHLDFYPNGGRIMAGCEKGVMNNIAEV